jgi:DNA-binding NarL/FixJ family response regulator
MKVIRILIADDHPVVRKGLANSLAQHQYLRVVAEAADGLEALAMARELSPDLVLMDLEMPKLDGLSVCQTLRREKPLLGIVIISAHAPGPDALQILKANACVYLSKSTSASQLVLAVETTAAGGAQRSAAAQAALERLTQKISTRPSSRDLDACEQQVLVAIAEGLRNKEIASKLAIGQRNVESHRERIMRRLNIHSIAGLTRLAVAEGLVPLG